MRQVLLRLVCDDCGFVATFEIMNSEPLTSTTNIQTMVERHGWRSRPKENSTFSTFDQCPACKES